MNGRRALAALGALLVAIAGAYDVRGAGAGPESVCCGSVPVPGLGGSGWHTTGAWGGDEQFAFCAVGARSCDKGTNVAVSYVDGASLRPCPSGAYACEVSAYPSCCTWSCSGYPDCGGANERSCCAGLCGASRTPAGPVNALCAAGPVTVRACCSAESIQVDGRFRSEAAEWSISYGYRSP